MELAIQAEGLHKHFGRQAALSGVDLAVPAGTVLGLLGPNGAGKTTTVKILSTLLKADAGRAVVAGYDVATAPRQVRRHIGLSGQFSAIDERLTGRENLALVGTLYHLGRRAARRRADELISQFGLTDAADRQARTYSGGMARRLDLAAALVASPPVLFLDEPTTGLDPASRQALWQVIREQVSNGVTVLLTTQYLEEADQLADRIVVVDGGQVIADGTAAELKRKVGAERLEITFRTPEDAAGAVPVIGRIAAALPTLGRDGRVASLPVPDGLATVGSIATGLAAAGLEADDFAVRQPSLDDVFLSLTGRPAEAQPGPGTGSGTTTTSETTEEGRAA